MKLIKKLTDIKTRKIHTATILTKIENNIRNEDELLILLLTKNSIKNYLDNCIKYWRKKSKDSKTKEDTLMAECYIDAFQSVRISILGETLPEEK